MSGLSQPLASDINVKAGTVTIYEAATGTTYNSATGWEEIGCLDPGSFNADFPREILDIKTGVPETTKLSVVVGQDGKLQASLLEYTSKAITIAAGGEDAERILTETTNTTTGTNGTTSKFTLTSVAGFAVGDPIEVVIATNKYETFITDITGSDVTVYPFLPVAASTAGIAVTKIGGWKNTIGGTTIRKKAYLVVFNAVNGSQAVIHVPQARATAPKIAYPHKQAAKLPFELDCYGITDPTLNKPVVAYHYTLMPGSTLNR